MEGPSSLSPEMNNQPMEQLKAKTDKIFAPFGSSNLVSGSKEFLLSNTMTAKFAFLIMVVIIFILLLRISFEFMNAMFGIQENPILVKGLRKANKYLKVKTTGKGRDIKPIIKSDNEDQGMEFTYTIWLNIDDSTSFGDTSNPLERIIFNKSHNIGADGSPKLSLIKDENDTLNLKASMKSYGSEDIEISIPNIPAGKWIHVAVRLEHHNFDVLVNGNIIQRKFISDVPKQNTYDVLVTPGENHGFDGLISNLQYHNRALNSLELMDMVSKGPNLKADANEMVFPPFLSLRWFGIGE
tara:strand:+ start:5493 stop:6383 length:891 start_codon:yes stop_codon:yes gene_type:complete